MWKSEIPNPKFQIFFMPCFSKKQQHVLGVCCLLYGMWLLGCVYTDAQRTIDSSQLANPDPPDMRFYIDPPIDVNAASLEELQLLPGIGPVLAERIVVYRQQYGAFTSIDALQNIHRIGPKTVQKIRYYLKPIDHEPLPDVN
jgi:competence ComEA-like helix-hairpin-helix protein